MNQQKNGHDPSGLNAVFQQYETPLLRYATRLTGDLERARDIVQDVFLQLCRQGTAPAADRMAPWLYTVCRNRAFDVRKKERPMHSLSPNDAQSTPDVGMDPADSAERQETVRQARAMLASLPENQQEVIRLKIEHGLKYREISEVTGLSVSNVGYLIHHGLLSLRRSMDSSCSNSN